MEFENDKPNGDKQDRKSSDSSRKKKDSNTILPEFDVAAKVSHFTHDS